MEHTAHQECTRSSRLSSPQTTVPAPVVIPTVCFCLLGLVRKFFLLRKVEIEARRSADRQCSWVMPQASTVGHTQGIYRDGVCYV